MAGELITGPEQVSAAWLTSALGRAVEDFEVEPGHGNWSRQLAIRATLQGGDVLALRLKLCAGNTFGRSEVDYYMRDYIDLPEAPLVRCFEGRHEPGLGYHLLLEDLSATHADRRDAAPTLAYGLAVAEALGRLHRHRWGCEPPPAVAKLDRYFDEIRPGLLPMEAATGHALRAGFEQLERNMRERWADPQGMALLHGDLNPTNVLTPRGAEAPVLFIDRQPFDWSLTYGLAVSDLAYFMIPWWPEDTRRECEEPVLRRWHEALERHDYPWALAQADWRLSVAQCMNVPMEWCSKPETLERMRWLWQAQYGRIRSALQDGA